MIYRGDKVLHTMHPEWGVGIVKGEKYCGYIVEFQASIFEKGHTWISGAGHLVKVNGWSQEEIKELAEEYTELIRQKRITEQEGQWR